MVSSQRSTKRTDSSFLATFLTVFMTMAFLIGSLAPSAHASLASIGTSVLQWLSRTDIVGHQISVTVDTDERVATFKDDVTIRSRGGRSVFALLGDDFLLKRVIDPQTGEALDFGPFFINMAGLPFTIYRVHLPSTVPSGDEAVVRFEWTISDDTIRLIDPFHAPGYFYVGHTTLWHPYTPDEGFFTADIEVTTGRHLQVIADGERLSETIHPDDPNLHTVRFRTNTAVNGIGFGVGSFRASEPIELDGVTIRPMVSERATRLVQQEFEKVVEAAVAAHKFMSRHIAPSPFRDAQVVEFPFYFANAFASIHGLVYGGDLRGVDVYDDVTLAHTMTHEVVHSWFGSAVSIRVIGSAWLSEGLGEYLGYLSLQSLLSPDEYEAYFESHILQPIRDVVGTRDNKALGQIEFLDEEWRQLRQKGAYLFSEIHRLLGDDHFFELLRAFYEENKNDVVSGADFINFSSRYVRSSDLDVTPRELENLIQQHLRSHPVPLDK